MLGLLAFLLEIGAWTGVVLIGASNDVILAWYLTVHLLASLALAFFVGPFLPAGAPRERIPLILLLAGCSYAVPVAGFLGVVIGALMLRFHRPPAAKSDFESLQLPEFEGRETPPAGGFQQVGMRSFLNNREVPVSSRIGAMVALKYVPGRVSSPLLRDVLSDPSEDIRLLAYGMLDNHEKRINRAIDEELKAFSATRHSEGEDAPGDATMLAAQRLSDLYWELFYQELAQGDLRDHAINESLRYCEFVLMQQPDNAPLNLRHGRLLKEFGQIDEAEAAFRRALKLGLPATRVLPYLAELCFEQRNFAETRRLMQDLANWGSLLPRLQPILDYWTPAR
ncbi:MAG: hypothetical protein HZT41_14030 [Dechloromonas sp.]|nr:MAG: hypothetical protein HZT41_14030 [Dechloromonas sp.]